MALFNCHSFIVLKVNACNACFAMRVLQCVLSGPVFHCYCIVNTLKLMKKAQTKSQEFTQAMAPKHYCDGCQQR